MAVPSLSNAPGTSVGLSTLLGNLRRQYTEQATQRVNAIRDDYQSDINAIIRRAERWEELKSDLRDARDVINGSLARLKSIRRTLDTLSQSVTKQNQADDPDGEAERFRFTFDNLLGSIRNTAEKARETTNLLGNTGPINFSFRTNTVGISYTVTRAYAGAAYTIADGGNLWVPDYAAKQLREYSSYPDEETGAVTNLASGIGVADIAGDTATITIAPNNAGAHSFTGTLTRTGTKLVDAWYYDGLATQDGRDRAAADLAAAKAKIDREIARFEQANTVVGFSVKRAEIAISGYSDERFAVIRERDGEAFKVQQRAQLQLNAAGNALTTGQSLGNSYSALFRAYIPNALSPLAGNPVGDRVFAALLDIGA